VRLRDGRLWNRDAALFVGDTKGAFNGRLSQSVALPTREGAWIAEV
jgi:hypothetical protein